MLTITTDKGYKEVSRDGLFDLPTPEPTRTWSPIPHAELAGAVSAELVRAGFRIQREQFCVSPDGMTCLGGFEVQASDLQGMIGYSPAALFVHDNKKNRALSFGVGGSVWACSNGLLSATWSVRHKHVPGMRDWIGDQVALMPGLLRDQSVSVASMRRTYLNSDQADVLFTNLGRHGIMPWSKVGAAVAEYDRPEHHEMHGRDTIWSWYNAVTEAAKRCGAQRQLVVLGEAWRLATAELN